MNSTVVPDLSTGCHTVLFKGPMTVRHKHSQERRRMFMWATGGKCARCVQSTSVCSRNIIVGATMRLIMVKIQQQQVWVTAERSAAQLWKPGALFLTKYHQLQTQPQATGSYQHHPVEKLYVITDFTQIIVHIFGVYETALLELVPMTDSTTANATLLTEKSTSESELTECGKTDILLKLQLFFPHTYWRTCGDNRWQVTGVS